MAGRLSTHVLDTARGRPAEGLRLVLDRIEGEGRVRLAEAVTNADGRTDAPLLSGEAVREGVYEITFRAGDWLRAAGLIGPGVAFLDEIPIRFGMRAGQHYHVPLLLSPYGYATYRGS